MSQHGPIAFEQGSRILNRIPTLALLFLLASCTSQSGAKIDPLAAYIGKSISEARSDFGKPNGMYDMQNGTYEYIWSQRKGATSGSGFMGIQIASGNPKGCNTVLITNAQKTIVDFRYEGKC